MIKRLIPWFLLIVFSSALGLWTYNMFNVKDYLIKFDVNGGSKVASLSVKKDNKLKNLPITSKENCEFVGCTHIKEQNCGIKKALEVGKIDEQRYQNYVQIYKQLKEKEEHRW